MNIRLRNRLIERMAKVAVASCMSGKKGRSGTEGGALIVKKAAKDRSDVTKLRKIPSPKGGASQPYI